MNENKTPVQPLQDVKAKDEAVTETQYIEPQGDDEDALELHTYAAREAGYKIKPYEMK